MKANGYYTVVLTPFNRGAYHSGHAYQTLGVDRIIQPQELGYPGKLQDNLWTISTEDMLKYVKEILAKETDKPVFIFSLTMYEHGPYKESHHDDYGLKGKVKMQTPLVNLVIIWKKSSRLITRYAILSNLWRSANVH